MIRRAEIKDLPEINHLLEEVLKVHNAIRPDIFKGDGAKYTRDELINHLKEEKKPIYVYVENNKVVGHLFLEIREYESNVIIPYKSVFVDDLCILDTERGKGIGKALMEFAFEYAKSIGAKDVSLNVWNKNEDALKFYEKLGLNIQRFTLEKSVN